MAKFFEKTSLYPFLVAIYPILFLLSVNISEISPITGLRSALVLLVFSGITFLFFLLITRNTHKSALITLIVVLAFFLIFFVLYAPAYRWLREISFAGHVLGRHRYLMPATVLLVLAGAMAAYFLTRKLKKKDLRAVTLTANVIGIVLVVIPLVTMVSFSIKKNRDIAKTQAALPPVEQTLAHVTNNSPDIYYLILDMLTSDNVLAKLMKYDDSEFTQALEHSGFFVSKCSRSNYRSTQLSITSSMNMDYIQNLSDSRDLSALLPLMRSSLVERSLEAAGYKTYAFESGYSFTDLQNAAKYYQPVSSALDLLLYPGVTPFESLLMQVSGGRILYETRDQLSKKMQYIIDAPYVQYRDRILYTLVTLPTLAQEPGPKFVFAHILAPHDPFVFDEDGNPAFRRTPFSLNEDPEFRAGYGWNEYSVAYVEELKYLHQQVLDIVDRVISSSSNPPVIIIQGDHGIPRSAVNNAHFEIYNAYYFGGVDQQHLYDTISPVNSFRAMFNAVFSTAYPLLNDKYYEYDKTSKQYVEASNLFPCP